MSDTKMNNLSNQCPTHININSFPVSKKDMVIERCLEECKNKNLLEKLTKNCSYEGGFELPLSYYWNNYIYELSVDKYNLMKQYHSARQLRFVSKDSKTITGLRCKDAIPYWSKEEIESLVDTINAITSL